MFKGMVFGLAAGALWGMVFIAPRLLDGFSPMLLSVARYLAYGVFAVAMAIPLGRRLFGKVTARDWRALAWLSLAGNNVYYLLLAGAIQMVGVAPTSLIIGMMPVLITLAGSRDQGAMTLRELAGPLTAICAGIAAINADVFLASSGAGTATPLVRATGILCAFGALFSWTAYAIGNARYLARRPVFNSHEWSLLTGVATGALALLTVPLLLLAWRCGVFTPSIGDQGFARFILVTAAVAIGASIFGNGLWNAASRRLPMTLGGQMIIFEVLFATAYGFLYDGRWPRPLEWLALCLLVAGVTWSARRHSRPGGVAPA
ncbi:DMT family transporter [Paludibacterium paludis]|uniref:EamA domain-containing protein n=1 Tax=Paludibacterium paludis TaxID=1225769 RepID=A0A918P2E3_9NEIS|nr:DMT family transporter [Paludibacterium paludis]GGY12063.1 hypothetical protein GCM10011289_13870 [Paludibacterium paludis]